MPIRAIARGDIQKAIVAGCMRKLYIDATAGNLWATAISAHASRCSISRRARKQLLELLLADHLHSMLVGCLELGLAGVLAGDQVAGLLADRAGDLAAG